MRIDGAQVRELRRDRLWSQEELAVASGLNLRTIQRIEAEGVISLQSKKSLAAAFDFEVGAQGWSLVKMTEILGGDGGNTVMVLAIFQRSVE